MTKYCICDTRAGVPHGYKQNRCFSNNICYLPGRRMLEMMEITLWCSCQLKNVIKIIEIFRISRLLLSYFSGNVVTNLCHVIWYDPCHCSHSIYISLGLNIFPEKEKSCETWAVFGRCINILQDGQIYLTSAWWIDFQWKWHLLNERRNHW